MTAASNDQVEAVEQPTVKPPQGVVWNWPSLFLVQRSPSPENPDASECPVLLAPSQGGLDFFDNLNQVRSIWFVRMTQEGLLTTERVLHLCLWRLYPGQDGTYLTALLCESGAMFVVDGEQVYEVDEVTRKCFAGGNFEPARKLHDTFTINAVVVAKLDELDVVTVRSDESIQYSISRHTSGVSLEALEVGMRVQCFVSRMQRVLSASVLGQTKTRASEAKPAAEEPESG